MEVAVGFLGGENDGNPAVESRAHFLLGGDDFRIAFGIDHQSQAHGFDGLMNPGIGENVAFVCVVRFAAQGLGGFNEIVDAALALREVGAFDVVNAMRNPIDNEGLGAGIPERTVDGVFFGVNDI